MINMYKIILTAILFILQVPLFAQIKKITWGDEVKYGYNVNTTGNGFDYCGNYKDNYFIADNNNGESTVRTYDISGHLKNTVQIKHEEKNNYLTITNSIKTKTGFHLIVKSIDYSTKNTSIGYLKVSETGIINPTINKIFEHPIIISDKLTAKYMFHIDASWLSGILSHKDSIHHSILYYTIKQGEKNNFDTILNAFVIDENMQIVKNVLPIGIYFSDNDDWFKTGHLINDDTIISVGAYYPKKKYKYQSAEGVYFELIKENKNDPKKAITERYNFHFPDLIFKQLGIDLSNQEKNGIKFYSIDYLYSKNEQAVYVFLELLNFDYPGSTGFSEKDSTGKKYIIKNPSNFSINYTKSSAGQIILSKIDIINKKLIYSTIIERELYIPNPFFNSIDPSDYFNEEKYYYPFIYNDNLYILYDRNKLKDDNTENKRLTTVLEKFDATGKSVSKEILKDGKIMSSYCSQIYGDKIRLTSREKTNLILGLLQVK